MRRDWDTVAKDRRMDEEDSLRYGEGFHDLTSPLTEDEVQFLVDWKKDGPSVAVLNYRKATSMN